MEQSLRRALDSGGFRLAYQPWFTPSGNAAGFEALLRLVHPERGLLDASEFIKTAEESGLIVPIGDWVLREACRQLSEWRSQGLEQTLISVNVSPQEISRANYADDVAEILLDTEIPPSMIQLELTESALIGNLRECSQQMKLLRELGVRLAIDDFGAGYSSFNWLQNLPVDTLKIDRSFLCGAAGPDNRLPLIQAIIALGRNMGLTLVAAGVETQDQLSLIHSLLNEDGDFVQGDLLSRPLAPEGAREFLKHQVAKLGYIFGPAASPNIEANVSIADEHCAEVAS
jgi:EAL domain-containing protein (putative c-di-GMP-specific phosphodiesterase class I)